MTFWALRVIDARLFVAYATTPRTIAKASRRFFAAAAVTVFAADDAGYLLPSGDELVANRGRLESRNEKQ
jgi:hypothetical protein